MLKLHLYANIIKYLLIFAAVYINNYINWLYFYIRFIRERNIYSFIHARHRALFISLMKFFTYLAAALLSLSSTSVFAQDADNDLKGDLKFENALDAYGKSSAPNYTPMVFTSEGNIIVTGSAFPSTAAYYPGGFVALTSKTFPSAPIWKVIFNGNSNVTTAVADDNGGAYIGGNFVGTLTLAGVEGDIVLESSAEYGSKVSAYVAHINKEGKILAATALNSSANQEMVEKYPETFDKTSGYCNINKLAFIDGKLYAGLMFSNVLTSADGSKTISSSTYDASAWYMGVGCNDAYTVAEIDASTMCVSNFPVLFDGGGSYTDASYLGLNVKSANFVVNGSKLYLAASVNGFVNKGALFVNGQKVATPSFDYNDGNINDYLVAKIDLANSDTQSKVFDGKYSYTNVENESGIGDLQFVDGDLWVSGAFRQNLPFDNSIKAVGNTDLFAVSLNPADLTVKKTFTSAYNETTTSAGSKEYFSLFVSPKDILGISGYVGAQGDYSFNKQLPIAWTVEGITTSETNSDVDATEGKDYITGSLVDKDNVVYYAWMTNNLFSYYYQYDASESTGVKNIEAATISKDAVIYNLQGMKLRAPQKGLNIVNGKKVFVK